MCKLFGFLFSGLFYAAATILCFGLKMYVECHGEWNGSHCQLTECEESYMWFDLWGSMVFIGPIVSALKFRCGFSWWRVLALCIAIGITIGQMLSLWGCCFIRKRSRQRGEGKDKKSKKKRKYKKMKDEKEEALNTECEV